VRSSAVNSPFSLPLPSCTGWRRRPRGPPPTRRDARAAGQGQRHEGADEPLGGDGQRRLGRSAGHRARARDGGLQVPGRLRARRDRGACGACNSPPRITCTGSLTHPPFRIVRAVYVAARIEHARAFPAITERLSFRDNPSGFGMVSQIEEKEKNISVERGDRVRVSAATHGGWRHAVGVDDNDWRVFLRRRPSWRSPRRNATRVPRRFFGEVELSDFIFSRISRIGITKNTDN
jgi:hypothetical protein